MFADSEIDRVAGEIIREIRERLGRKDLDLEAAIQQAIHEQRSRQGAVSVLEGDFIAESLLLQHKHPDEFVVFKEGREERGGRLRHVINVLFHSKSWDEVCQFKDGLSEQDRKGLIVEFKSNPIFAGS